MNGNIPSSFAVVVIAGHEKDEERPRPSLPPSKSVHDAEHLVVATTTPVDGEVGVVKDYRNDDDWPRKRRRKVKTNQLNTINDIGASSPLTLDDVASMDVDAYLAHVDQQRRSLPDVFVAPPVVHGDKAVAMSSNADAHEGGSLSTMRVFLSEKFDILPPPSTRHLPPPSVNDVDSGRPGRTWVEGAISNFSNLRTYLEKESCKRQQRGRGMERQYAVPRMRDRAGWHVYCLGREQAYGNISGYHYDDDDDNDDMEAEEKVKVGNVGDGGENEGEKHCLAKNNWGDAGRPPTISLLLQFDQVLVRSVFSHHVHYLLEWMMPLTSERALWLYALLAMMEKPLHREECVAVRGVLRECCRRRWQLVLPPPLSVTPHADCAPSTTRPSSVDDVDRIGKNGDGDCDEITMGGTTTLAEGDDLRRGAKEQLALLNTIIAITGVYFEQGASSTASSEGRVCSLDSLFCMQKSS